MVFFVARDVQINFKKLFTIVLTKSTYYKKFFVLDKSWLNLQYHQNGTIKKPGELEDELKDPPEEVDKNILNRVQGSMIGMALGDAVGAHVEFRPKKFLEKNPVTSLEGGGTWGLEKGQVTTLSIGVLHVIRMAFIKSQIKTH